MRILICNDDGFSSLGIKALVEVFKEGNELYVVAPAEEHSGKGHSMTFFADIQGKQEEYPGTKKAYKVWGTPADCAYLGIYSIMDNKPDLLISGINHGANLSLDNIYSGTLGAATEGIINGIPSIAVSLDTFKNVTINEYLTAAKAARKVAPIYLQDPQASSYVCSINVPCIEYNQLKGIKATVFDPRRKYHRQLEQQIQSDGTVLFHTTEFSCDATNEKVLDHGDITALEDGYVSLTPIGLDWVEKKYLESIASWQVEL